MIPKCEKIKQLQAICKICNGPASFTLRTQVDDRIELIGGGDMYMPVCRECFNFKTQQQENLVKEKENREAIKFKGDLDQKNEEKLLAPLQQSPFQNTPDNSLNSNTPSTLSKDSAHKLEGSPL